MGADITVLREREVDYDSDDQHKIAEVLIRKVPDDQQVNNSDAQITLLTLRVSLCVLCITLSKCMVVKARKYLISAYTGPEPPTGRSQFSLYMLLRGKRIRLLNHHNRATLKIN